MCYFQRVIYACGCPIGVMRVRPCAHVGTPECQRRHLLDRARVQARCELHAVRPGPTNQLNNRRRPPRRSSASSSSSPGGVRRRTGGFWLIRRGTNSGGGGGIRGGGGGSSRGGGGANNSSRAGSSP